MANLDGIIKSLNINHNFIGQSSQISTMTQSQNRIINNLSGFNIMAKIAKSLNYQTRFANTTLSAFNAINKSINWQFKMAIPASTIEAISIINRQHEQLFGNLKYLTESLSVSQSVFSQMNNWQFALSSISGQLAAIAATQEKWDLLENFKEITEEAVAINGRIVDNNGITKENLKEIKSFLQRIEVRVDKIDRDTNAIFWKLIALLSFLLAVFGEVKDWQSQPEYVTKQEVEAVIKEQFNLFDKKLKEDKEYRTTNRKCKVMLKPTNKSIIIETLPENFELIIMQVHHKWTYASFNSPKDNLPQAGWIMKKYLDRPK